MRIVAVVLAAGESRRFGGDKEGRRLGGDKLAARLANGNSVLAETVGRYAAVCDEVVAVVRPDRVIPAWPVGVRTVVNAEAARGMATSLACGVAAARDADGWLIALGDMPFVACSTIRAVRDELVARGGIVVPCVDGAEGHPVGFAANFGEALLSLYGAGDRGAKALIIEHAFHVSRLQVGDTGILRDIDVPEDLPGA